MLATRVPWYEFQSGPKTVGDDTYPLTVSETIFNVYNVPRRLKGDPAVVQAPVEFYQDTIANTGYEYMNVFQGHISQHLFKYNLFVLLSVFVSRCIINSFRVQQSY